jgi:UDP-2,4-diacetamido-2,4,6-trideoxy-beta-L-altropyranose hydrolase
MIVVIRADADSSIGLGHVTRCLSLAEALVSLGCRLILVSTTAIPRFLTSNYGAMVDFRVMTGSGDDVLSFVASLGDDLPDWVVVDHYRLDARWHSAVRQALGCRVLVIDDLADRRVSADIVVDHNPSTDHQVKYRDVLVRGARVFGGPRFALISSPYSTVVPREPAASVRSIGIFVGGTDPLGISGELLRVCRVDLGFEGEIEVVTTKANDGLAALRTACDGPLGARLSVDLPDLVGFYQRHDLYIGAGGGSTWERCCCGAPSLVVGVAENQRIVLAALETAGAALCVYLDEPMEFVPVRESLKRLLSDHQLRRESSIAARQLVDGNGSLRIAVAMAVDSLGVRTAGIGDARLTYEWRNDPSVRQMSRDPTSIDFESHLQWFRAALMSEARHVFISEIGRRAVGVIRYDRVAERAFEVSLYCDPVLTGLGIGSAMLAAGEREIQRIFGDGTLITAFVVQGNSSSERMFKRSGFVKRDGLWHKTVLDAPAPPRPFEIGGTT